MTPRIAGEAVPVLHGGVRADEEIWLHVRFGATVRPVLEEDARGEKLRGAGNAVNLDDDIEGDVAL